MTSHFGVFHSRKEVVFQGISFSGPLFRVLCGFGESRFSGLGFAWI